MYLPIFFNKWKNKSLLEGEVIISSVSDHNNYMLNSKTMERCIKSDYALGH